MSSIEMCHSSKPHTAFDFEGLEESLVDNNDDEDEDDDFPEPDLVDPTLTMGPAGAHMFDHNLILVRDALIRDAINRTEEDIEIIVRFLSAINSNHDHNTRKRLAPHFVLAEIESRDTRVLTHDEKLDAYCIVAAGSLRHVIPCGDEFLQETVGSPVDDDDIHQLGGDQSASTGFPHHLNNHNNNNNNNNAGCINSDHAQHQRIRYLHIGDEFGAHLNDRVVYGEIFTNEDFVWVLCVPHVIFDEICGEKAFRTIKDEVTGNVIEMRTNSFLPSPESPSAINLNISENDLNHSAQANYYLSEEYPSYHPPSSADPSATTTTPNTAPNSSAIPPKTLALPSPKAASPNNDNNELIRATKERLYELVLNSEPSEVFIEDFLLTFRIWAEKDISPSKDSVIMNDLMNRICNNIRSNVHVENCVRIVLLWMVNHFQDFQNENRYLLEQFEQVLKERNLRSHLRMFYMNLSAKSIERQVTVTRSDRNSSLPFLLVGGYECGARLFIGELCNTSAQNSPQHQPALDLRPGDRVISINGVDCHVMPIARAHDLCRSSTHLSLHVKYDPHLFNALIEGRYESKRQIVETFPLNNRLTSSNSTNFGPNSTLSPVNASNPSASLSKDGKKENNTTGHMWKQKVKSLVSMTTNQLINSTSNILNNNSSQHAVGNGTINHSLNNSSSNSSISSSSSSNVLSNSAALMQQNPSSTHSRILSYETAEIIKIYYFENNDCRFLPIHSSTTARECIQLALREFQLTSNSSLDFALYEYSVIFNNSNSANGIPDEHTMASSTVVKRMSDGTSDLVRNLGINSRLYLKLLVPSKDSNGGNSLSDSDIAKEIIKDSSINSLTTLDANTIARELTARDFRLFCKIEAQQFVYDLAYNGPNNTNSSTVIFERTRELQEFEQRTNQEMFWAISQVLEEKRSLTKRVKVIKHLIRIANVAVKLNNFNSMFAILGGLSHISVNRLKNCWDKVPSKEMKKLHNLQKIMDPSRNFYNFRQKILEILSKNTTAFIIIPFFPLVKKDLSFIWMANQTYVNSKEPQTPSSLSGDTKPPAKEEMLVNWEKMRLLSEKIREIQKMNNTTSLALAAMNGMNGGGITSPSVANEPIDPNLLFRIFADATTSDDPRTFSHKRLWENQRMTKRVQSFLDDTFTSVTSDETELLSRSHSCELPQTPNSSHNATTRSSIASTMSSNSQLSHPSPTPSSASSSSNSLSMHSDGPTGQLLLHRPQRPKFGQTSPNQLRKLLALSDGSVVVPHNNSANNNNSSNHHNANTTNHAANSSHHHSHNTTANNNNNATTSNHSSSNNQQAASGGGREAAVSSHHHFHHQYSHNIRSSNSSLNSSLSGSTSYYSSMYGPHPHHSYSMLNNQMSGGGGGYGNGSLANSSNYYSSSHQKMYSGSQSQAAQTQSYSQSGNCCSMPSSQMQPCCGVPQSGALYPNQSYCSCCTPNPPLMRSSIMMMPPPQTSGLMHPVCPCTPNHGSSRRQSSLPPKQPLPVESSSVTSFRRLEQFQMTRYHHRQEIRQHAKQQQQQQAPTSARRPQCPDYDTTMQRISGGNSVTVNGAIPPGANSNGGSAQGTKNSNLSSAHHHRSNAPHHREDIV